MDDLSTADKVLSPICPLFHRFHSAPVHAQGSLVTTHIASSPEVCLLILQSDLATYAKTYCIELHLEVAQFVHCDGMDTVYCYFCVS